MRARKMQPRYNSLGALVTELYAIINNEPTFTVTLTTGTASTVVSNALAGIDSVITFMPTTAGAATEDIYVSTQGDGEFTIAHSSGASVRTFKYAVYG